MALSGLSWERFGALRVRLGPSWSSLGPSWGSLGPSGRSLGCLWGSVGAVLEAHPAFLDALPTQNATLAKCTFSKRNGAIFVSWGSFRKPQGPASERLEPASSRLRGVPRRSGAVLGCPLRDRGRSEGSAAAPVAARSDSERRRARWERLGGGRFDATETLAARAERGIVVEITLGSSFASRISLSSASARCHCSPFPHALIPAL